MQTIELIGDKRANTGKAASRELRRSDAVPCVLYGGSETIHFSANEK